jgi:hypothetical protein
MTLSTSWPPPSRTTTTATAGASSWTPPTTGATRTCTGPGPPSASTATFNDASIHVKDLALAAGFAGGELVRAPGRAIDGWESHHLNLMATHLTERGYQVLDNEPAVLEPQEPHHPFGDPVLGALRVFRYDHDATGIVPVDDVGEVFIRLDSPADETPALTPAPDTDDW